MFFHQTTSSLHLQCRGRSSYYRFIVAHHNHTNRAPVPVPASNRVPPVPTKRTPSASPRPQAPAHNSSAVPSSATQHQSTKLCSQFSETAPIPNGSSQSQTTHRHQRGARRLCKSENEIRIGIQDAASSPAPTMQQRPRLWASTCTRARSCCCWCMPHGARTPMTRYSTPASRTTCTASSSFWVMLRPFLRKFLSVLKRFFCLAIYTMCIRPMGIFEQRAEKSAGDRGADGLDVKPLHEAGGAGRDEVRRV